MVPVLFHAYGEVAWFAVAILMGWLFWPVGEN